MGRTSEAMREVVCLVVTGRGGETTEVPVLGSRFLIGRARSCQLRARNPLVSREHAVIESEGETAVLRDLGSRNGTFRNGTRVSRPVRLWDGDSIQVGPVAFAVSIRTVEGGAEDRPAIEDQVASWLIDEPERPDNGPDMGLSGGATHVGTPRSDAS